MSLAALLSQTVTVVPTVAGATDDYGNVARADGTPVTYAARVEQRDGTEHTTDGDVQISDWVAYLPPDAVVSGRDRLILDGVTFEIVGPPAVQFSPRGPHHVVALMRHVSG